MKIQSQSQLDLQFAAARVTAVKEAKEDWIKTYGGLCHSFPILVRTAGLAQALAFHESKGASKGSKAPAHRQVVADFQAVVPRFDVGTASLSEYMSATRRVLRAWVFYKRFAVSILNTEAGDDDNAE